VQVIGGCAEDILDDLEIPNQLLMTMGIKKEYTISPCIKNLQPVSLTPKGLFRNGIVLFDQGESISEVLCLVIVVITWISRSCNVPLHLVTLPGNRTTEHSAARFQ